MNIPDTIAFLTWLSQTDGRIQVTEANVQVWSHALAGVTANESKLAALEYYKTNEQVMPTPAIIRKHAHSERDRNRAKQSALTAAPVVRNPNSFRSSDPERWDMLVRQGAEEHRAKLRARGITPHPETCPTCRPK